MNEFQVNHPNLIEDISGIFILSAKFLFYQRNHKFNGEIPYISAKRILFYSKPLFW
jgi:hypothetical protein